MMQAIGNPQNHADTHKSLRMPWHTPDLLLVSIVPILEYKKWNLALSKWATAVRRHLYLDVIPAEQQCSYCHCERCDSKGKYAVMR